MSQTSSKYVRSFAVTFTVTPLRLPLKDDSNQKPPFHHWQEPWVSSTFGRNPPKISHVGVESIQECTPAPK